jgi:CheY-like chemotaxis protein
VIGLTSSSEREDIIESYHSGANSHIRKPVDSDEFAAPWLNSGFTGRC